MKKNAGLLFLTKWIKSPLSVASVTPSSPQLASAMCRSLPDTEGVIVELGGGTGPITRCLLAQVSSPQDLLVVERDAQFAEFLGKRFPGVRVLNGDAMDLCALLDEAGVDKPVRAVVSGLPLLSMSQGVQRKIVEQAVAVTGKQGCFIQFSYGLNSPVKKVLEQDLALEVQCTAQVWRNVPPAKVWLYRQKNNSDQEPWLSRELGSTKAAAEAL